MVSMQQNIKKWIEKTGFTSRFYENPPFYDLYIRGSSNHFVCRVSWHDTNNSDENLYFFRCDAYAPVKMNENKIIKIMEFVSRVNIISRFTFLLMDYDDGIISCRNSCISTNPDIWDERTFDPIFRLTMRHLDNLFPYIMELNYTDITPQDAINKLTQPEQNLASASQDRMFM